MEIRYLYETCKTLPQKHTHLSTLYPLTWQYMHNHQSSLWMHCAIPINCITKDCLIRKHYIFENLPQSPFPSPPISLYKQNITFLNTILDIWRYCKHCTICINHTAKSSLMTKTVGLQNSPIPSPNHSLQLISALVCRAQSDPGNLVWLGGWFFFWNFQIWLEFSWN